MKRIHSITALALTGVVGLSVLTAPIAASASEAGKRNTAIGLGAAAAALLLTQKDKLPGILVAGAAVIAASQTGRDHHRGWYSGYDNRDHGNRNWGGSFDRNNGAFDNRDRRDNNQGYRINEDSNRRDNNDSNNRNDNHGSNSGWNHAVQNLRPQRNGR